MTTLKNGSFEHGSKSKLLIKKRKKNDYVKLEAGAYPRMLLQQLEDAAAAVATGKLSATKMVRLDKRSGRYVITIGFGGRHTWFQNDYIARGEAAECAGVGAVLEALDAITKAAKAGEFDEALEALRIRRQAHAETMIKARDVCGFHSRRPSGDTEGDAHDAEPN